MARRTKGTHEFPADKFGDAGAVKITDDGESFYVPAVLHGSDGKTPLGYNNPLPTANLVIAKTDQPFSGTGNATKTFTKSMFAFVIKNKHTATLTFSIDDGEPVEVEAGESFNEMFDPFTMVTIAAAGPWKAYGLTYPNLTGIVAPPADTPDTTTPGSVTLTAGTPTESTVPLSWTAATDNVAVTGYKVYNSSTLLATTTGTTHTVTGLAASTQHGPYTVKAIDAAGNLSAASNAVTVTTATPAVTVPVTPTGLAATPADSQVSTTWNAVTGATSYKVYRNGSLLASPTTNAYTDTTAANGTAYSYTVSSVNSAGESAQSSSASATPAAAVTIPATPTGLTATAGNAKVDTAWTPVSGATSYKVYRGGTLLASPTTASYSDATAVNGTAYSYTVSAVNSAGESAQSSAQSATPAALTDTTAPDPVIGLTAGTPTSSSVPLTWTLSDSGDVATQTVEYSADAGGTWNLASASVNASSNTYNVTGLTASQAYSFRVSAVDAANNRSTYATATATTAAPATLTDDFNRADSTTSLGIATTGQAWAALVGTWGIIANQAYCVSATGVNIAVVESGKFDATIQAKFATVAATNMRLAFRVVDATNMLVVNTDSSGTVYKLFKQVAGTFTALGTSTGVTPTSGDVVKVVTSGSNITVYVNNVQVITATCTDHQTATKHGLANNLAPSARYDDFSVV